MLVLEDMRNGKQAEEALQCSEEMSLIGRSANNVTSLLDLKACSSPANIAKSQEVRMEIVKTGFEHDLYIGCALIVMHANCMLLLWERNLIPILLFVVLWLTSP
jgi:hypothetical protein